MAKEKANNMLIEPDLLNMLDRGDNKVTLLKLTKYGLAAGHRTLGMVVFIDRDANVNHGRPFGWLESYLLSRGGKRM